jgi:uncharacterized Tic20 family protein
MENTAPSPTSSPNPSDERTWSMWCHMSALAGIPFPAFGCILGPLIVWQMKRNESPLVEEHGKEAFNFQLSMLLYLLAGAIIAFVGMFFCIGWLLIPVLAAVHYGAIIFGIIAGIKANEGAMYRYPLNLRLIK